MTDLMNCLAQQTIRVEPGSSRGTGKPIQRRSDRPWLRGGLAFLATSAALISTNPPEVVSRIAGAFLLYV